MQDNNAQKVSAKNEHEQDRIERHIAQILHNSMLKVDPQIWINGRWDYNWTEPLKDPDTGELLRSISIEGEIDFKFLSQAVIAAFAECEKP